MTLSQLCVWETPLFMWQHRSSRMTFIRLTPSFRPQGLVSQLEHTQLISDLVWPLQ